MSFSLSMPVPRVEGGRRLLLLLICLAAHHVDNTLASPARTTDDGNKPSSTATTGATTASSPTLSLSSDITSFIPSCALSCFKSFVEDNFDTSVCGSSPSLECLCRQTGASGYTIGEGATECIVAEDDINECHGMGVGSSTVTAAYEMCSNQTDAAPETHATLIATILVNSGSIVVASPTSTSTHATKTSSSLSSATPARTLSSSSSTTTTTTAASSMLSAAPAPTSSSSSTNGTTSTSTTTTRLSGAQVAGITSGCVAAVLVATLLAMYLCIRRRRGFARMRDSWEKRAQVQGSPSSLPISAPRYQEPKVMSFTRALAKQSKRFSNRVGVGGGDSGGGGNGGGIGLAIGGGAAAVAVGTGGVATQGPEGRGPDERRLVVRNGAAPPSAPSFSSSSRHDHHLEGEGDGVVGLSSPPRAVVPPMSPRQAVNSFEFFPKTLPNPQQRQKRQRQQQEAQAHPRPAPPAVLQTLPTQNTSTAKPNLAIAIPPPRPQRLSTASAHRNPFHGGRDSVVTEFAEDGEDSAVAPPGSAQIWRRPNADPQSATTYYVSDRWGNWVLHGTIAPDDTAVRPQPLQQQQQQQQMRSPECIAELATPISKTAEEREMEMRREREKQQRLKAAGRKNRPEVDTSTVIWHQQQQGDDDGDADAVRPAMAHLSSPTIPEAVALGISSPAWRVEGNNNQAAKRSTIRLVTPDSGRLPMNARLGGGGGRSSRPHQYGHQNQRVPPRPVRPKAAETPLPSSEETLGAEAMMMRRRRSRSRSKMKMTTAEQRQHQQHGRPSRDSATTIMSTDSESTAIVDSPVEGLDERLDEFPLPSRRGSRLPDEEMKQMMKRDVPSGSQMDGGYLSPVAESYHVRYPEIPRAQSSQPQRRLRTGSLEAPNYQPRAQRQQQGDLLFRENRKDAPALGVVGSAHRRPTMLPSATTAREPSYRHILDAQSGVANHRPQQKRVVGGGNQSHGGAVVLARSASPDVPGAAASISVPKRRGAGTDRAGLPSQMKHGSSPMATGSDAPSQQASAQYQRPSRPPLQNFTPSPSSLSDAVYTAGAAPSPDSRYGSTDSTLSPPPQLTMGSTTSTTSTTSSSALLAKRVGAEKAARFQIEGQRMAQAHQAQGRWMRRQEQKQQQGEEVAGGEREGIYAHLPATPGWQPQLTPKKKGEDLYLSVR